MADLVTNINQAISDFGTIKQAIINKGVEVPNGTKTSEYGNLINSINEKSENNNTFKGTILPDYNYKYLLGDDSGESLIFNPGDNNWEITMCFNITNLSTNQTLIGCPVNYYYAPSIELTNSGYLFFGVSTNGSSWTINSGCTIEANKMYWARISYSNISGYTFSISEDGKNYKVIGTNPDTTVIHQSSNSKLQIYYVANSSSHQFKYGAIFVNKSQIKISDAVVWGQLQDQNETRLNPYFIYNNGQQLNNNTVTLYHKNGNGGVDENNTGWIYMHYWFGGVIITGKLSLKGYNRVGISAKLKRNGTATPFYTRFNIRDSGEVELSGNDYIARGNIISENKPVDNTKNPNTTLGGGIYYINIPNNIEEGYVCINSANVDLYLLSIWLE